MLICYLDVRLKMENKATNKIQLLEKRDLLQFADDNSYNNGKKHF